MNKKNDELLRELESIQDRLSQNFWYADMKTQEQFNKDLARKKEILYFLEMDFKKRKINKLKKWIENNIPEHEMIDKIMFVPAEYDNKIMQYLKITKQDVKFEYRASYTWLAIYL